MLVGRADELRRLDDLVTSAVDGSGGALLVAGRPGAGVTSVLDAAARRAARRAHVVRVRCYPGSSDGSLLHDLLGAVVDDAPPAASIDVLVDALRRARSQGPLVVVIDDADRADSAALRGLAEAVARVPELLTIGGAVVRLEPVPSPLAAWDQLVLGPLDAESSLALARAAVGRDAPALRALVPRLHGNPRALHDVPRLLPLEVLDGRWPLPADLPVPTGLVEAWAGLLPPPGSPLHRALLQAALCAPAPPAAGPGALGAAVLTLLDRCGLLDVGADDLRWVDPWLRDIVVARADAAERERAHRALASAARADGHAPSVVAFHLTRSASGRDDEVADALEAQAVRAERLRLPDVAPAAWAAAAARTTDPGRRVRRAVQGARSLTATGPGMDTLGDLLGSFDHVELEPEQVAVRDRLRSLLRAGLDPDVRVEALRASLASARQTTPALVPALLWELSVLAGQHGDHDVGVAAGREYCSREEAHAPGCGPPWTGRALLCAALFQSGQVAEAEVLRREVHEASSSLDPATADLGVLFDTVVLDDLVLDVSPAATERLLLLLQRLDGEAYPVACLYGIQGWRARARGDLATARRMMRDGLAVAVPTSADDVVCGLGALAAELASIAGDDEELDLTAATLRPLLVSSGDRRRLSTLDRALGLRALVQGRLEEASVHLAAAAEAPLLGRGLRDGVLMARVDLVEVLGRCDDGPGAQARAVAVLEVLEEMSDPLARALAARVRALTAADDEDAVRLLDLAVLQHRGATDTFEHGRTVLLRGERLRRLRRRGAARLDLLEAARLFRSVGAAPWLERSEAELRAAGGNAEGVHERPASRLTAQELAVARAAANGATNREVAQSLFLSTRTVEYHLGNVYRKLGVHGRGALGARFLAADGDP